MKWRKIDGYHETHQYVSEDGQIVGEVRGPSIMSNEGSGWRAFDERLTPVTNLGRYISLELAKTAVERAALTEERNASR